MAERANRSRRIVGKALSSKRKLCFDSVGLGNVSPNIVQHLNVEEPQPDFQAEPNGVIQQPQIIIIPGTSNSQSHLPSSTDISKPKIKILSDKIISGPSNETELFSCGETIIPPQINVSPPGIPETDHQHFEKTFDDRTDVETSLNYGENSAPNIVDPKPSDDNTVSPYLHARPLSPVVIINNGSQNTLSPDEVMTYETLENVDGVEILALPEQLEKNVGAKESCYQTRTSKRNKQTSKQKTIGYMDFKSEEEPFEWSSSSWDGEDDSLSSDEAERNTRKKRVKIAEDGKVGDLGLKKEKKRNKRKDRALKRNIGVEFIKKDGSESSKKDVKENPCKKVKCPHNCHEITEERRKHIFDFYYSLSSQRKRDWLVANTQVADTKRQRSKNTLSRRQNTYSYYINEGEGRRQVCQKFILNTLDLSQRFVHYTISNSHYNLSKTDLRGKHIPFNKTSASIKQEVVDYIKNLPAVPSHYCRKDSTRLYLPQEFKNLANLYQLYKADFSSHGKDYVGEKVFRNVFTTEFNIAFHAPKKDKCKKCVAFTNNPIETEEEKKEHLKEAEDSKARFKFHQNITKHDTHTLCVSFDLQKVLNTPYGESMLYYYSRKYSVYNLTFYESVTREGYCYSWGESDGKRGGNEIATILLKYIQMVDDRTTVKHLLLYSDSCSGQNKNKTVFAAIHFALQTCQSIESIQMNFLLPGHTSMPVDSVHAVIENSVKNTVIHAPSQWATVFTLARKNPKPYNVQILKHDDFVAWDSIANKYFKNNLAGKLSQVRVITFKKSDPSHVSIKKSMRQDEIPEKVLVLGKNRAPTEGLYKKRLPISDVKYNDLVKLCKSSSIPQQYHNEYISLPHGSVKDTLPDTDVEDSD